ncbi:DUF559 domain-containing protein [Nocardioides sp. BP30]|uniref:DUF559 domain-containing protein n=1 Tax=Nocardioides sp. BP30 TaxID=3036374 RepID=UPI00246878C6|nr:DUF559 domain-containing protein [Nocardioides sp. BP30]WGL53406.1 DUF559 domain-containing protein [Nocardioides sp. BP30]
MTLETITVADLERLGIARHTFYRRARAGDYRQVLTGVWVERDQPVDLQVRAAALARVVGPGQVVVDRSAAWLHGIDVFEYAEPGGVPMLETCARPGRTRSRRRELEGGIRDLAEEDVERVEGVAVTTPLRTAADLGARLRRREAYAALNEFGRLHGVGKQDLRTLVRRFRRRRGVVQLRELIELIEPRVESPRESWVLLTLIDAGLPMPEPQWWIDVDGVPTYRLDFAWPSRRVCVEYDGQEAHGTAEHRRADEVRRAWLREHGWTVIVVRLGDFSPDRVDSWTDELRRALRPTYDNRRW